MSFLCCLLCQGCGRNKKDAYVNELKLTVKLLDIGRCLVASGIKIEKLVFQPRSKIIPQNDFHVSFCILSKEVRKNVLFCLWFISQGVSWIFYTFVNETTQGRECVRFLGFPCLPMMKW